MRAVMICLFSLILSASNLIAQEGDLKGLYTDVTDRINAALLTRKGSSEISGYILYNHMKTEYEGSEQKTETTLQAEPGFSYFIFNNFSAGIQLSYLKQSVEFKVSSRTLSSELTLIGPVIKYYIGRERIRPYVLGNYLFINGEDADGREISLGIGLLYHLSGNLGINTQVKFGAISSDNSLVVKQNRILFGVGLSSFAL